VERIVGAAHDLSNKINFLQKHGGVADTGLISPIVRFVFPVLDCFDMLTSLKLYIYSVQVFRKSIGMENVSISEFRANLLKYLTLVQQGAQINVTSKGRVMATLTPPLSQQDTARTKLAELAETATIHDVVSPTGESWNVMK